MCGGLCVSCLRNPESVGVHSSLASRMCSKKCTAQAASAVYVCGELCVSCLRNSESVGVLSSLAQRNVQWRLLQQYMCGGLRVSCPW